MIDLNTHIRSKQNITLIKPEITRTKYLPPPKYNEPASPTTRQKPEGIKITLSLGAQAMESAYLLKDEYSLKSNPSLIGRGSLKEIECAFIAQLSSDGEDADLLTELPDSQDPARLELARQAVDFVLTEKNNPFAGLSREKLSHIAYEDTGAFTSAERYAAFKEIDERDSDYYRSVMEQEAYELNSGTMKDSLLFLMRAKYRVSQSMSKAEQVANGEMSAETLKNRLDSATAQGATLPKERVEYANLLSGKDQMVVSSVNDNGESRWQNLSIHELLPEKKEGSNLDIAAFFTNLRINNNQASPYANWAWITLYQRNDAYR